MRLKEYLDEDGRNPKKGDRFEYKGKKLTVNNVGSGLGHDKYITVQFDKEKNKREISMKNFFKGSDFKYINEMGGEIDLEAGYVISKKVMQKMKKKYKTYDEFIKHLDSKATSLHSKLSKRDHERVKSAYDSI